MIDRRFSASLLLILILFEGLTLAVVMSIIYATHATSLDKEFEQQILMDNVETSLALQGRFSELASTLRETVLDNVALVSLRLDLEGQLQDRLASLQRPQAGLGVHFMDDRGRMVPAPIDPPRGLEELLLRQAREHEPTTLVFRNLDDSRRLSILSAPVTWKGERLGTGFLLYDLARDETFWERHHPHFHARLVLNENSTLVDLRTGASLPLPERPQYWGLLQRMGGGEARPPATLSPVRDFPGLFLSVSHDPLQNKKHAFIMQLAAVSGVIFLMTAVLSIFIARKVSVPLRLMAGQAMDISEETTRALLREEDIPYQEFQTLARAFNRVVDNLHSAQEELTARARRELDASERRSRVIIETSPTGILSLTPDWRIVYANPRFAEITGYGPEGLGSLILWDFFYRGETDKIPAITAALDENGVARATARWLCQNGRPIWVELAMVRGEEQDGKAILVNVTDITDRKLAEDALKESEERYRSLVENIQIGIIRITPGSSGELIMSNPAFLAMFGFSSLEEFHREGRAMSDLYMIPEDRRMFSDSIMSRGKVAGLEILFRRRDNSPLWGLVTASMTYDRTEDAVFIDATVEDITERKRFEKDLEHQAFHDDLTALPNRALFIERLSRAIARYRRRKDYLFAVLYLDLDRFKLVNDSLGHSAGDQLLKIVAERLLGCMRSIDTVSRFGGDEFAIIFEEIRAPREAIRIAKRIREELSAPFDLNGHTVFSSASIGIVLKMERYEQPEQVIRDADLAMYRAKELGKSKFKVFNRQLHDHAVSQLQLETDLRRAIEGNQFTLLYQPIMDLKCGHLTGFEALIRWQHPIRGMLAPAEFIDCAEETGLIVPMGQWVLREACRRLTVWRDSLPEASELSLSVNLSCRQFSQTDLVEMVRRTLDESSLDPSFLCLEITESTVMENEEAAIAMLERLKALGVRILIDDFGRGYSSLAYLRRLPIDGLKIDRSFVRRIETDTENKKIVRAIIDLAHNLGLSVTAEGIERQEHLLLLATMDCEYGQGYFFAKPLAPDLAVELFLQGGPGAGRKAS